MEKIIYDLGINKCFFSLIKQHDLSENTFDSMKINNFDSSKYSVRKEETIRDCEKIAAFPAFDKELVFRIYEISILNKQHLSRKV